MDLPDGLLGLHTGPRLSPGEILVCCGPVAWLLAIAVELVGIVHVLRARLAPILSAWALGLWLLQGATILATLFVASFFADDGRPERRTLYDSLARGSSAAAALTGTATLVASTALFFRARRTLTRRSEASPAHRTGNPPPAAKRSAS